MGKGPSEIQVENIYGPILILSGKTDDQWPAPEMSDQLVKRLKNKGFKHPYEHVKLDGGHVAPLNHFELVYGFLEEYFGVE